MMLVGTVGDISAVEIARVDTRDQVWELDLPHYRVYFWDADAKTDEYELSGAADVICFDDGTSPARRPAGNDRDCAHLGE